MNVYIARQPIFDINQEVVAYELLYRDNETNAFNPSITNSVATSILLVNSHLTFGMDNLVYDKKAFINFGENLIMQDIPSLLSKSRIIIEILETVKPTKEILSKVIELKEKGYLIALDDYTSDYPYEELVELADIIKVDFVLNTPNQIREILCDPNVANKHLLAEKVETKDEFEWAKRMGFAYFQGYFFAKPTILKEKNVAKIVYRVTDVMHELTRPYPDYKKLADIIQLDVALTYQILRLVNSKFTLVNNISSIQHAISMLGITSFKKWFYMSVVHQLGKNKPSELVKLSLTRMRMMEQLAIYSVFSQHVESLKFIGLLSTIDALVERSMYDILKTLPVSNVIKDTLLQKFTIYSGIFKLCLHYEKGEFEDAEIISSHIGIDFKKLPDIYIGSVSWAEEVCNYMDEEQILEIENKKSEPFVILEDTKLL